MDSAPIDSRGWEVRQLASGEAQLGADGLVESHADYPAFVAVCPDHARRRRLLRPLFTMTVRDAIAHGEAWAQVGDDTVHGLAVWAPPETFPWSTARGFEVVETHLQLVPGGPPHTAMRRPGTPRRPVRPEATSRHDGKSAPCGS